MQDRRRLKRFDRASVYPTTNTGEAVRPEVERELVRKCKAGDARFFEPLVRAYEQPGLRVALGMMGNADDARDALQEAFVKTFKALGRFDLGRSFGPWFFQILRNQCRDQLRSRQARFKVEALDEGLELRSDLSQEGTDRRVSRQEAQSLLWRGLEKISEEHREIIVLKELQGFRYSEIASILEVPEGTVASRLYHARRALKDALIEMGIEYP